MYPEEWFNIYPVHNQAKLNEYDLFERSKNKVINYALFVDIDCIKLYLKTNITTNSNPINIYIWDYSEFPFKKQFLFKTAAKVISNSCLIIEDNRLSLENNYLLEFENELVNVYLDSRYNSKLANYFAADNENWLGQKLFKDKIVFKTWSPPASRIDVILYDKNNNVINLNKKLLMTRKARAVWEIELEIADLDPNINPEELFYQYLVFAYGKAKLALDPYSLSMAVFNSSSSDNIGKGAIINHEKILPSHKNNFHNSKIMQSEVDMIAYEIHVRDFTIQPEITDKSIAGTYMAFVEKIPYLKQLGISHVQLMPVHKFYTVNEENRNYNDGSTAESNYNWGYDPMSFFSVEGWFSTNAANPYSRILELQNLVKELHNNNIGVIFDVVYNHTYIVETFENIAPGWYYRFNDEYRISGHTGAGPGLETRHIMVRKLICDSIIHLIKIFGADGLRFDLLSFFDHETAQIIRKTVNSYYSNNNDSLFIMHGEGWNFTDIDHKESITKLNPPAPELSIALFNDTIRDAITGYKLEKGVVNGNTGKLTELASGISGGAIDFNPQKTELNNPIFFAPYNMFAYLPSSTINLLSIHDGFTLWDKLNISVKDSDSRSLHIQLMKMATTLLFTSFGKIIWHGGDELFRTKPLAKNDKEKSRAYSSYFAKHEYGTNLFHENSYCSPDFTNMIRWEKLSYANNFINYFTELIKIRKNYKVFTNNINVNNTLEFIKPELLNNNYSCNYTNFKNLPELTLNFINGPANTNLYLCGEIHPENQSDNPLNNPYILSFNKFGEASIKFNQKQIKNFNIGKWGNNNALKVKLVYTQGLWDFPEYSYSPIGNNQVFPQAISNYKSVTINLAEKDYVTGLINNINNEVLVYKIKTSNISNNDISLFVISNFSDTEKYINNLHIPNNYKIIANCDKASINGINDNNEIFNIIKSNIFIGAKRAIVLETK